MIELLLINATYVAYRLIVTAHVVKFFNRYVNYYVAVLLAAQISFAYDYVHAAGHCRLVVN